MQNNQDLVKKDINYSSRDFSSLRANLIDFTKVYFPQTYQDFSESSPQLLNMELAAYVGDVLSFYTDTQLKESILTYAEERGNVFSEANVLGYKAKNVISALTSLDVYQKVPAIGTGSATRPDFNYALQVQANMLVGSSANNGVQFRTLSAIDFSYSSSLDPTEITVYQINQTTKQPVYYLLKKSVNAVSGKITTETFTFGSPKIYDKLTLNPTNVIEILDVYDGDGNQWYEVPYLAQDTIFQTIQNNYKNDPTLPQYRQTAPYLLKLLQTARRFVKRVRPDSLTELQFGAGISSNADEEIIPNPTNVGLSVSGLQNTVDLSLDPSNFLYTRTYGQAPANTTLTVRYTTGGGLVDNVSSNDLTNIVSVNFDNDPNSVNPVLLAAAQNSIACTNPNAATGGASGDNIDDVRNLALSNFAAQNRAVTKEDYIVRCYSMPARYGAIAKAYLTQDDAQNTTTLNQKLNNPLALNLYVLGKDSNGNLVTLNDAVKQNLITYLQSYRIVTDAVNIRDAYVIDIGVNFEIVVLPNYNSNEVILRVINTLKNYFQIDKWQINQPLVLSDIITTISQVVGVQNVVSVNITNLYDTNQGYNGNIYDIGEATRQGIIYPSIDPSCFQVHFGNTDIKGRAISM